MLGKALCCNGMYQQQAVQSINFLPCYRPNCLIITHLYLLKLNHFISFFWGLVSPESNFQISVFSCLFLF